MENYWDKRRREEEEMEKSKKMLSFFVYSVLTLASLRNWVRTKKLIIWNEYQIELTKQRGKENAKEI